jgi:hypothetical protein
MPGIELHTSLFATLPRINHSWGAQIKPIPHSIRAPTIVYRSIDDKDGEKRYIISLLLCDYTLPKKSAAILFDESEAASNLSCPASVWRNETTSQHTDCSTCKWDALYAAWGMMYRLSLNVLFLFVSTCQRWNMCRIILSGLHTLTECSILLRGAVVNSFIGLFSFFSFLVGCDTI